MPQRPKQDPNVILTQSEYLNICEKCQIIFDMFETMRWITEPNENLEGKPPLYCDYNTIYTELKRIAESKNIELD
jgi:hypothetical protein